MRIKENSPLLTRPIAHRGLWGKGVQENSITAYLNAVNKGYPIEIDLYASSDGEIFSIHDENLFRLTGVNKKITSLNSEEIKKLTLNGTNEKIPTFKEVLKTVNGKVSLLIEIKDQPNGKKVIDKTINELKNYKGEFALQSFNPLYIGRIKRKAPEFIRGILATDENLSGKNFITRFIVKHMSLNFLIKPDFISYLYTALPIKKRKTKNKKVFAWTIKSQTEYEKIKPFADNIIFENFIPEI